MCHAGGTVLAWGDNTFGQTNVPADLTNAISIAGGQNFSMALRPDGTVVAWGDNSSGQTNVPADLSNVVAIAAGGYHALALKSDGTVTAWGAGMTDTESSPDFGQSIVPLDLTNAVAISAGLYHSVALRADGTVVAWGDNSHSQTNVPVSCTNVIEITAGDYHSLAMKANRTVIAWGDNSSGQTNVPINLRLPNFNLVPFAEIAAGGSQSLLLLEGGDIKSWGSQTSIPSGLFGYGTIISENPGTIETSLSKTTAQDGNVVINGGSLGPLVVYGGTNGLAISANGQINFNVNPLNLPASAYSRTNWGTASQIPDFTAQGTANTLFDFNRFIAVADLTPELTNFNPNGNNHFTNLLSFINAARAHTNSAHAMEGVIVTDVNNLDRNQINLTENNLPQGINIKGTLLLNFTGTWNPVTSKIIVTTALNINPADLSGLVATNPATYTTGYPPVYTDPTKNPTNVDITSLGFTNFAPGENLPALMGTIGVVDIHGNVDVSGTFYTPSYMEIENKGNGQTQYVRGQLITGNGAYLENVSSSTSIFSSDSLSSSGNIVAIAAHAGHNLALNASGHVAAWGDETYVPSDLANVTAIAAGGSHNLALVVNAPPTFPSQPYLYHAALDFNGFSFFLPSRYGKVYAAEYKNALTDSNWTALPLAAGNGYTLRVTDPAPTNSQRFYRVQQW